MSNYRRADTPSASYFFTVVTFRRRKILINDDCRIWLRSAVMNTRKNYPFTIDAWVLLPEHLHCIISIPENDNDFSVRWNGIKKRFTTLAKHVGWAIFSTHLTHYSERPVEYYIV